jgi:hypothetical protein
MENVWNQKQQLIFPLYQLMFGGDLKIFTSHTFEIDVSFNNNTKIGSLSLIVTLSSKVPKEALNHTSFRRTYHMIETEVGHGDKFEPSFKETPYALVMKKPKDMCLTLSKKFQLLMGTISHFTHNTYLQSENHFCFFENDVPKLKFLFRDQTQKKTKVSFIVCCKENLDWSCA